MKWYGFLNISLRQILNKKKNFNSSKNKTSLFLSPLKINLNLYKTNIYIPSNWNIVIFKNNNTVNKIYIYFYSNEYFFFVPFDTKCIFLKFDNQIKLLEFRFFFKNNYINLFLNYFKNIFFSFSRVFFKKLKFKGKGYYIFKNYRNTIALQFGYSHLIYVYAFIVFVKFLSKTSIFMFGINSFNVNLKAKNLYKIRPINIFTGKGIRLSRQIIYKKTGKVSSYR